MKTLDVARLRECLSYAPESGVLTWRVRPRYHFKTQRDCDAWNTQFAGQVAGAQKSSGHLEISIDNQKYRAHRVAWAIYYGEWPPSLLDHKDVNPANNAITNLRLCTLSQNQTNSGRRKASGLKGCSRFRDGYKAQIKVNGKNVHLGVFDSEEAAHRAYCAAADKYHGEFANHGKA